MINTAKKIFIIGIKGVAMSNIAVILKKMGKTVTGSDKAEIFITDSVLKKNKIRWSDNFDRHSIPKNTDLVIFSASHLGIDNPQLLEAKKRGITILSQAQFLGELIKQFDTTIAVSGCHGKTTTSSMLAYALIKLKADPSYLVGAPSLNGYAGGDFREKSYFVIEADEYGISPPKNKTPKFHFLKPDFVICTNIDYDHPDVYENINQTIAAFEKFFDNKKLIVCADDDHIKTVLKKFPRKRYETFGFSNQADLRISLINKYKSIFKLMYKNTDWGKFTISLFGEKNISNAAAVILMLSKLGFPLDQIRQAIQGFSGASRRFELVHKEKKSYLFDDYGHHPVEIDATIAAARNRFPQHRVIVIFQPHTYSRTQTLLPQFVTALAQADYSFVLPIYPSARERVEDFTVSSQDIETEGRKRRHINIKALTDKKLTSNELKKILMPSDIVITMGAGDVYALKNDIIKVLKMKSK